MDASVVVGGPSRLELFVPTGEIVFRRHSIVFGKEVKVRCITIMIDLDEMRAVLTKHSGSATTCGYLRRERRC